MARARNTDPLSSHSAAAGVEATGKASQQRTLCLEAVRKSSGDTAAEIAEKTGLERHAPSRRLPELRDAHLVYNGEQRKCRVTGNLSLTWHTFGQGAKQANPPADIFDDLDEFEL